MEQEIISLAATEQEQIKELIKQYLREKLKVTLKVIQTYYNDPKYLEIEVMVDDEVIVMCNEQI